MGAARGRDRGNARVVAVERLLRENPANLQVVLVLLAADPEGVAWREAGGRGESENRLAVATLL